MKLGRIARTSLEGLQPRLIVAQPEHNRVIDLATAEYTRLRTAGASTEAARRLAAALYPSSMTAALESGPLFLDAIRRTIASLSGEQAILAMDGLTWLAPIDPPVMRDCLVFEQHLRNSFMKGLGKVPEQYYERPLYYKGNSRTLIGHEQEVLWPGYTQRMDYELELGFVIARPGNEIKPEQALSYLLGVTIGSSSTMMWSIEELIAYISKGEGIQTGDLIGSGTVGFGCGLELGKLLNPGDVVELEISGIGVLRNRIGQPSTQGWQPTKRTPTAE